MTTALRNRVYAVSSEFPLKAGDEIFTKYGDDDSWVTSRGMTAPQPGEDFNLPLEFLDKHAQCISDM